MNSGNIVFVFEPYTMFCFITGKFKITINNECLDF